MRKRKIVQHVNDHFSENMALAEAESLASYGRKRLALSYEKLNVPPKSKSHSPNEHNMTWDIQNAISELESFSSTTKVNWSEMSRKYNNTRQKMQAKLVQKDTAKSTELIHLAWSITQVIHLKSVGINVCLEVVKFLFHTFPQ